MRFGFLENVYHECLELEFKNQNISFKSQSELQIYYKQNELKQKYKPDFICYDLIVVELKAVTEITNEHKAQVFNYLKASRIKLGMIISFGQHNGLKYERIIF